MKLYYDLHIHSCLSPCGDDDMTPNNIVNMAALKGLDVIAVSDHNSCLNARAAMTVGKEAGVLVIPAMELTVSEDFHVLCLFEDITGAEDFGRHVRSVMPKTENNIKIFGNQFIMDDNDVIIGSEEYLLIYSSGISASGLSRLLSDYGGIAVPAHADKDAYSILSVLGYIDTAEGYSAFELSGKGNFAGIRQSHPETIGMNVIVNSDAHYLGDISERLHFIEAEAKTAAAVIDALRSKP